MTLKKFALLVIFAIFCNSQAYAHGGGVDSNGCHSKELVRHCHGRNDGKYIPEKEASRVLKVHAVACKSPDAEGRYPKRDYYGKRCNDVRGR